MPQYVQVGEEYIEFPDDMDDAQIEKALASYSTSETQPTAQQPAPPEDPGLLSQAGDLAQKGYGVVKEMITGEQRMTPEMEALPDVASLPEMNELLSWPAMKVAGASLFTDPKETIAIFKANFPENEVRTDAKGNFIIKSNMDGKEYALKPGFSMSDIGRTIAQAAPVGRLVSGVGKLSPWLVNMFERAPAAKSILGGKGIMSAAAREGLKETGIQTGEALAGGEMDALNIAAATGIGGALSAGGKVLEGVGSVRELAKRPNAPGTATEEEVVDVVKKSLTTPDTSELSRVFPGNMDKVHAAEKLGVDDLLTPAEVIDRSYKNSARIIDSMRKEAMYGRILKENHAEISNRILGKIKELGTKQMGELGPQVKKVIREKQEFHHDTSRKLYGMLRTMLPEDAPADASETLTILQRKIDSWKIKPPKGYTIDNMKDGQIAREALDPVEHKVYKALNPKEGTKIKSKLELPESARTLGPDTVKVPSTYTALDEMRMQVGNKYRSEDWPSYKELYRALTRDQDRTLTNLVGDESSVAAKTWKAAKENYALEKSMDKDLARIFGRKFEEATQDSMVPSTTQAMSRAANDNTAEFREMIEAIPAGNRPDYLRSALLSAVPVDENGHLDYAKFGKLWSKISAKSDDMGELLRNNMDKESYEMYSAIGEVATAINESKFMGSLSSEAIKDQITGRKNALNKFLSSMLAVGVASGGTAALGASLPLVGGVGASVALLGLGRSFMGQTGERRWADFTDLFKSPAMLDAIKAGFTPDAVAELAKNNKMQSFAREFGQAEGYEETRRWINNAIRAERNLNDKEEN